MPSDREICPTQVWLSALAAQGRSTKTLESYSAAVGKLRAWHGDDLASLTWLEAMSFANHLRERAVIGRTARA